MNDLIQIILLILVVLLMVSNGFVLVMLFKRQKTGADSDSMQMMNQNIQGMQERLDRVSSGMNDQLGKVSAGINERLDNAAQVIGKVSRELGSMQEIGRNMQSLQDFLKSPKLRGNIGEQVLKQMLEQFFPAHLYDLQYRFKQGQMVDAVIKTEAGTIPIDSKFPMENFQRMVASETEQEKAANTREFVKDVKKHITEIANKYILPDEGTVDFAVMYIPSEAVYYEVIRNDVDLNAYGIEKKVLFVSPNSLFYFLRVVMTAMQEQQLAQAAKEIVVAIRGIQKDAERFGDSLGTLNSHITHAKSAFDKTEIAFEKLSGKIDRIDELGESKLLE